MKRAGYIITLMIAFWMVAGGLFFAQSVQAKVVSGSCGGETKYRYDSKSKKLELYGRGVVSQTIRVDEQLSRKNRYFQVKKLVIRQGITAIKDSSVLQYASEEERGISDDYELGWGFDVWRGLGDATEKLYVELPEGFTTITANMFGDIQVREIYIPASVTKIEEGAFGAQIYLTSIRVSFNNSKYRSQNGVLYNKKMTTLICYPMGKEGRTFVVPDTVRQTAPLSFKGNYYLKKIVLPKNLHKLGEGSFFDCILLKDVNLETLNHLERISDYYNKSDVRVIHYYDSENEDPYDRYVNGVDYFALDHDEGQFDGYLKRYGTFAGTGITSFRMPSNLQYIAPETFRNCEQLKTFYIGKAFRGKINYGEEGDPDTLFLYYAPIRLIQIDKENTSYQLQNEILYTRDRHILCQALKNDNADSQLTIPSCVTEIADGAFYRNSEFGAIEVKGSLERIGISAFACADVGSFYVKGGVNYLDRGSFYQSAISEWRCHGGVKKYEKSAFQDVDATNRYAIDMNVITKLYQELLYVNATTDLSYWVKTIWNWIIM